MRILLPGVLRQGIAARLILSGALTRRRINPPAPSLENVADLSLKMLTLRLSPERKLEKSSELLTLPSARQSLPRVDLAL